MIRLCDVIQSMLCVDNRQQPASRAICVRIKKIVAPPARVSASGSCSRSGGGFPGGATLMGKAVVPTSLIGLHLIGHCL